MYVLHIVVMTIRRIIVALPEHPLRPNKVRASSYRKEALHRGRDLPSSGADGTLKWPFGLDSLCPAHEGNEEVQKLIRVC